MAMKKKSQNTIDNRDKRFISEVFDAAIRFAYWFPGLLILKYGINIGFITATIADYFFRIPVFLAAVSIHNKIGPLCPPWWEIGFKPFRNLKYMIFTTVPRPA